jgi:hypothetical protein
MPLTHGCFQRYFVFQISPLGPFDRRYVNVGRETVRKTKPLRRKGSLTSGMKPVVDNHRFFAKTSGILR